MNNILISSAGRRVSLLNSFKTELKKVFPNAKVFASDSNPDFSAACAVADNYFKTPIVTDDKYIDVLLKLCLKNNIKIIIPTLDTELLILSKNQPFFKENGIEIVISNPNFIEECRDKRKTNTFFESMDILIPKTIDILKPIFPIFAKPYNGSLSKGILKIENHSELTDSIKKQTSLMFMEYMSPDIYDEYTIDMYFDVNHHLKCLVPRQRLEIRGGEISKGITKKRLLYENLKKKLACIKGAKGCITAQFFVNKKNEEDFFGIEINARFGGGYPLSYQAGALYPKFIIEEYLLKQQISFFENWEENILMLRYDSEIIKKNA